MDDAVDDESGEDLMKPLSRDRVDVYAAGYDVYWKQMDKSVKQMMEELIAAEEYWRSQVKHAHLYSGEYCPFCFAHTFENQSEHTADCAWRLAQE